MWLGGRDSNPDSQIQSLESYHWTTSQQRDLNLRIRPSLVNQAHQTPSPPNPTSLPLAPMSTLKTKCLNFGARKMHNGLRSIGLRHTPFENKRQSLVLL